MFCRQDQIQNLKKRIKWIYRFHRDQINQLLNLITEIITIIIIIMLIIIILIKFFFNYNIDNISSYNYVLPLLSSPVHHFYLLWYQYKRRTHKHRTLQRSDSTNVGPTNIGRYKGRTVQTSDWYKRRTSTNVGLCLSLKEKTISIKNKLKITHLL